MDTNKQVVSQEAQSGLENAPMAVEDAKCVGIVSATREADKEVVSSWQILSREENAPIPVETEMDENIKPRDSHPSPTATSPTSRDPPPAYDSLHRETSTGSMDRGFSAIEPDDTADTLPPRPEDRTAVGQLLTWIPATPRTSLVKVPRLERPIVIPQLDVPPVGESVPFQRCYSDILASHDIHVREFVAFIDGLTVAQAPTSALQGLKMVGAGISMVPLPFIGLAGKGISALATVGSGKSSSRAKLYLSRAAREYFAPRGLRLSIVKDEDLATQVLRAPLDAPRLAPLSPETLTDSVCTRRLNAILSYAAPLRKAVPEPGSEVRKVDKLARKHLQHRMDRNAKDLARLRDAQGPGRGFEGAVEEEKKCSRLRWLVIQDL